MKKALAETSRRREIQKKYNEAHGITPATINKKINAFDYTMGGDTDGDTAAAVNEEIQAYEGEELDLEEIIKDLEYKMALAAENLEFEQAALYRDKIRELEKMKTAQP
jgi:excinuclease ABC subunit B